jgi:DNA polymerase-1
MDKIYIVDAVNILFRAYYALGPMTNPKGESTGALYGFIRSLQKMFKDFSPKHFVCVFDGPRSKEKRTLIYSEYKSHRAKMPEDLYAQLEKALEFCELAGIPHLEIPGVEADDTIGSIAKWAEKKGTEVYICSSDKDLCQLVSPHVFVINVHKNNRLIDREGVKELFGVTPEQIVDYLAIMGDASDNIPGLEGFGPKTAAALLNEFGSLDNLLAHPEKVASEKKQEAICKGKEIVLLSRQLASLHLDVEFPQEEEFFRLKEANAEKLKELYHAMNFLSLLRELGEEKKEEAVPIQTEEKEELSYILINDEKELDDLVKMLSHEKEIVIDTETTDVRPMLAELVGIGFCVHPKKAWYVPANGKISHHQLLSTLKPLLENPKVGFYGHNLKYDLHVLQNVGINLANVAFDTMLASYLLTPQNQRHGLDELALTKFGKVKTPITDLIGKGKNEISMAFVDLEKVSSYCCEDVDYTCRLKKLFEKEVENKGVKEVLEKIELPLLPVLLRMERNGIFVDAHALKKMSHELSAQLKGVEAEIHKLAGEEFNINSPKQLSQILFEKMGIKPVKKTTTGFSTSADVLEALKEEAPIAERILEYRTIEKLLSTYLDALPTQVNPKTKRIHCTFSQSTAATGRLSSQDPNLQNIPIRRKEGKKIREAFKPQHPGWSFLAADYSQVELRLLAHLSEDPALVKAFREGEDVHAYTASLVFDVPLKEVTSDMRQKAKAVNFGIVYGQQAFGLSEGLGIHYKEAAAFIHTYFERYKKVKEYLEFCKESVRKTGRAVTLTGRQRPIPEITSKNPAIRAQAERLAINTPLQGTAADLIKLAMIDIDGFLQREKEKGMMILQIHDELLFEAPDTHLDALSSQVKNAMENVFKLNVPLIVDISIGKNWGEC